METMVVLPILKSQLISQNLSLAIIPTVLIPLTGVTVLLSSLATLIAGWFGIKLKMEGPKQLLEVLLTKKVLIAAVFLNILFFGIYKGFVFIKTSPSPLLLIEYHSSIDAQPSSISYQDTPGRLHSYETNGSLIDQNFTQLNLKETWTQKLPKGAFRSGVISGGSIFYGSDDGHIYELEMSSGKILRKFYIGTNVTTRPIIYRSHLFAGEGIHDTHHARIYSFDLKTGKFSGAFQSKGHTEGQPLIGRVNNEELLFLTAGVDGLYAISPLDMKEKWHAMDGHLDATVSLEENVVYAGSGREKGHELDRSYAVAYDFSTGKKLWKKELPLSNWMHPIVGREQICYSLGEIYRPSSVGLLYCLDKKSGTPLYSIPFEAPLTGKPLLVKNDSSEIAIVSSFKGDICAVDLQSHSKIWCAQTGKSKTKGSFSSADFDSKRNILWYASMDNGLFAFDIKTGKLKSHWLPKDWSRTYASATINDDALFVADIEGKVRRIDLPSLLAKLPDLPQSAPKRFH